MEDRMTVLEGRVAALEGLLMRNPTVTPVGKKISEKEFLLTKHAKSEVEKMLVLAYYLERTGGLTSFNTDDLEAVFRAAKEKLPKNINDAANKNVARAFFMEAEGKKDSKKAWYLTSTGERYVEDKLNINNK